MRRPIRARGKTGGRKTDMNGLERRYAERLALQKAAGEIHSFRYEAVTRKLADNTRYTPDFEVILADGVVEYHEVKGFMRDDANVKLKVAAAAFPEFAFRLCTWSKAQGWTIKEV